MVKAGVREGPSLSEAVEAVRMRERSSELVVDMSRLGISYCGLIRGCVGTTNWDVMKQ